ncbi:anchored repeat-type ABC transporter ATP-binding subunit [Populibacterium corticicola]|uniref:Anchored repeat-type ABC transporter ATP-binding subunit n=1 Tax=Populibacterium corticicola TaxID=1812826 RepID=A0ABW5XGQ9_9MICO
MSVLSVQGVSVRLGGRIVLNQVNLEVHGGEFVGLLGPNGAGKTTLLRSILGLVPLASGKAIINGRSKARERGLIGYVPQRHEFAWDFPISVEEVVLSGRISRIGWLKGASVPDYEAAGQAIARVKMADLRSRPISELSGGQRQRVLVARALALQPSLLLLDEPFTGLDMPTQELLTDLFKELADEGKAIIMTTHDLAGAVHDCSRLCFINRRVIADGTPQQTAQRRIWQETFRVSDNSPLLEAVGV